MRTTRCHEKRTSCCEKDLRHPNSRKLGTFSMAADTRGQFHEWSKEQYVVRNSRCPLKLLPNNAPTLTRELSALSTSQTSRNEKVPANWGCCLPQVFRETRVIRATTPVEEEREREAVARGWVADAVRRGAE